MICNTCNKDQDESEFWFDPKRNKHKLRCRTCNNNNADWPARKPAHAQRIERTVKQRTGAYPYHMAKREARRRDQIWNIEKLDYVRLTQQPCYYCQLPLGKTGIGLDRLDNDVGYLLSNVVPCCTMCNYIKFTHLTSDEMLLVGQVIQQIKKKRWSLDSNRG